MDLQSVERLSRDLRIAAATLSDDEARFLVDAYYMMQDDRKRASSQVQSLAKNQEPNLVLGWFATQADILEQQIRGALDKYTQEHPMGAWMRQIYGIGPVISAGLLAHINLEPWVCSVPLAERKKKHVCTPEAPCTPLCRRERIQTAGQVWRYAGLDPTSRWSKGQKRPWNAALKVLTWKAGQSFMKFSGRDECFYGKLYLERKAYEVARNDRGDNAATAARLLTEKTWDKKTDAYGHLTAGRLPPAQIDARARRWAVKMFIAHLFEAWYRLKWSEEPPNPYPIAILGHAHKIEAPV